MFAGSCFGTLLLWIAMALALDVKPPTNPPSEDMTSLVYYVTPNVILQGVAPFAIELEEMCSTIEIPDFSGEFDTPIGDIKLDLSNMSIDEVSFGSIDAKISGENQDLEISITDCSFAFSCDYNVKQQSFPYLGDDGTGTISTDGLEILLGATGTKNTENGGMNLAVSYIKFDVGDLDIDLDGGFISDIIDGLADTLTDKINDLINEQFGDLFLEYIQPLIDEMNEKGLYVCEDEYTCIDYRITKDPEFSDGSVLVYLSGWFYNANHPDQNTQPKYEDMGTLSSDKTIAIQYGSATFQSLFNALQLDNIFDLNDTTVKYDDIVAEYAGWKSYPSGTDGKLNLKLTAAPTSSLGSSNLDVSMTATLTLTPIGQTDTTNISTNVTFKMSGDVWWKDYHDNHDAEIDKDGLYLTVKLTLVDVSADNTDYVDLAKMIADSYQLTQVNTILDGQTIPAFVSPGLIIENETVAYNGTNIVVSYNFEVNV